jgi:uncharacterized protein (DUF58 family)
MALGILIFLSICLFGIATNTESGWLFAVDSILITVILASLTLPSLALKWVEVRREVPEEAFEGERFRVSLRISPRSFLGGILLEVRDVIPPGLESDGNGAFWGIMPRDGATMRYEVVARKRGLFVFEDLIIGSSFPLGIARRKRIVRGDRKEVLVLPSFVEIRSLPILLGSRMGTVYIGAPVRDRGLDFRSMREYMPGESLRRVHWRTSARVGKPMIMEFEEKGKGEVGIALDLWRGQDGSDFELMVKVVASISRYFERCGVDWWAFGFKDGELRCPEERGWLPLLRWLARIEPDSGSKFGDGFVNVSDRLQALILVTADMDFDVGSIGPALRKGIPVGVVLVGLRLGKVEERLKGEGIEYVRVLSDMDLRGL